MTVEHLLSNWTVSVAWSYPAGSQFLAHSRATKRPIFKRNMRRATSKLMTKSECGRIVRRKLNTFHLVCDGAREVREVENTLLSMD